MKRFKIKIHLSILAVLLFTSCKDFVTLDPPKNQLTTISVFESNETANSALLNIYSLMMEGNTNPYKIALATGLAGDELTNFATIQVQQQFYNNALEANNATIGTIWADSYNYIYQANAVIEGCQQSKNLSDNVKRQLIAEAIFLRSYWHFYLVNFFGDSPLILSTDYIKNSRASRATKAEVYKQLVADLNIAVNDLTEGYVGVNGVKSSIERVRPNKYAALALLARIYLYNSRYNEAEASSTLIINNTTLYKTVELDNVFLMNSFEAIWQLQKPMPNSSNINTPEGNGFILTSRPLTNNLNSTALSPQLLSSFETNDKRKERWIGMYTDVSVMPSVDYYFPFKYKVKNGSDLTEYSMLFRLGEQYLIRAEARLQQGNLSGAIDDIDVLRKRAALPLIKNVNPAIDKENLLKAIVHERQVELFTEMGHRWFDLKRLDLVDQIMERAALVKGSSWNINMKLWPLPQADILNDNNLKQNVGYN